MIVEARAEGCTVFLSSHILTEVEQICDRVGIIREGQLVRVGGMAELKDIKRHEVTITFADAVPTEVFEKLDGVGQVETLPNGHTLHMTVQGTVDAIVKAAAHYSVVSLTNHEPSLEEVFLRYYESDGLAAKEVSHVVQ
jgi:ABC-2 type transport system ATP-binding protein